MTHEEILNQILSHSCAATVNDDGTKTFYLDAHCVRATIIAKSTGVVHEDYSTDYEIVDFKLEDN